MLINSHMVWADVIFAAVKILECTVCVNVYRARQLLLKNVGKIDVLYCKQLGTVRTK